MVNSAQVKSAPAMPPNWNVLRDLDDRCTLEIEPAFIARWNRLWSPSSNKPLTHIKSVYLR
jgi:hypothetical protein